MSASGHAVKGKIINWDYLIFVIIMQSDSNAICGDIYNR